MHNTDKFAQTTPLGEVAVSVMRQVIEASSEFYVSYEGSDPLVAAAFPEGFLPAYGSGLAFKGKAADGALEFYCLTDRGPNGDGPDVPSPAGQGTSSSKIFPAPGFSPSIGLLRASQEGAVLVSRQAIMIAPDLPASGLPLPPGHDGESDEVPLSDTLQSGAGSRDMFSVNGIDSEAIAWDARRKVLWISDEYGPFLLKVNPDTGLIEQRFGPGNGLPEMLGQRRANRGMEGMTIDPASDRVHAYLQSPVSDGETHYAVTGNEEKVERYARFLRWIEFDPATGKTVRTLAYPLDSAEYARGRTGNAKLGDLVALGDGKFVVIEQGKGPHGAMLNNLVLVEIGEASDISGEEFNPASSDLEQSSMRGPAVNGADWSAVTPLKKTLLLNLNGIGWVAEKAEGLALVDDCTLAMTNDNDFGLKTRLYDKAGTGIEDADITEIDVDAGGNIIAGAAATDTIRIAQGDAHERELTFWLLRFEKPLASYGL